MATAEREADVYRTHSWDRLPDETDTAWTAFCIFKAQTAPRSKLRVSVHLYGESEKRKASGCIGIWAREHRWTERAEAFDKHVQDQIDRVEFEDAATKARAAASKKEALTEKFAKAAEAMLDKGMILIQFPAVKQTTEDGRTVIKPGNLKVLDVGRKMIMDGSALAAKLGRIDVAKPDDKDVGDEVPALIIAFEGTVDDEEDTIQPPGLSHDANNSIPVQEAVPDGDREQAVRKDPTSAGRVN